MYCVTSSLEIIVFSNENVSLKNMQKSINENEMKIKQVNLDILVKSQVLYQHSKDTRSDETWEIVSKLSKSWIHPVPFLSYVCAQLGHVGQV